MVVSAHSTDMNDWNNMVKKFYAEKIVSNGFNLDELPFNSIPRGLPSGVLDAYNYLGGEQSDPSPAFYTFRVEEKDTYAVILTWGGGDGWLALLDHQGQLICAGYVADEGDINSINWHDSLEAAMAEG
jgi:hypothetical protein